MNLFKKNTGLLIRFDDIAPNMNWDLMDKCEKLFVQYKIKPVLGVIPNNEDEKQRQEHLSRLEKDNEYNNKKHEWKQNNPDQSIKIWKMRYIKGKIDKLPWN